MSSEIPFFGANSRCVLCQKLHFNLTETFSHKVVCIAQHLTAISSISSPSLLEFFGGRLVDGNCIGQYSGVEFLFHISCCFCCFVASYLDIKLIGGRVT